MNYINEYNDDSIEHAGAVKASKRKHANAYKKEQSNTKRALNFARYSINSNDEIDWDQFA
jgi:hypothetical protein